MDPTTKLACMAALALMACSSEPVSMTSGQTTTTYGNTNGSSASTIGTDDGDPTDSTEPDPTATGPTDPTDTGPTGPDTDSADTGWSLDVPPDTGLPDGSTCTSDQECSSGSCYVIPFLGGFCGECSQDNDCPDGGCSQPNPFDQTGPSCNMGELGAGCENSNVCADDLSCSTALDLLGLIQLRTCGTCETDLDCIGQVCAPLVDLGAWSGHKACIEPNSLPQDAYCDLSSSGDQACASGLCSVVDIMGLAEIGACGECNSNADCGGGQCVFGELILDAGDLFGSTCQ